MKCDAESKLITNYGVTDAALHDSQRCTDLLDENDEVFYAEESNRKKSKVRCRIEHIFGFMTNSMNGITIRSIGITRAWFYVGMTNLVYNFFRYEFLKRPKSSDGITAPI